MSTTPETTNNQQAPATDAQAADAKAEASDAAPAETADEQKAAEPAEASDAETADEAADATDEPARKPSPLANKRTRVIASVAATVLVAALAMGVTFGNSHDYSDQVAPQVLGGQQNEGSSASSPERVSLSNEAPKPSPNQGTSASGSGSSSASGSNAGQSSGGSGSQQSGSQATQSGQAATQDSGGETVTEYYEQPGETIIEETVTTTTTTPGTTSAAGGGGTTTSGSESAGTGAGSTQAAEAANQPAEAAGPETITVRVTFDSANAHAYNAAYPASMGTYDVQLLPGATVFETLAASGLPYQLTGPNYVSSIGGLAEKACGGNGGWMYSVDGQFPMEPATSYTLQGGEVVRWAYTVVEGDV